MTAQPLALRYVTSFTCQVGATALGGRMYVALGKVLAHRSRPRRHFRPAIYRHFGERRGHTCRDRPPPASAMVLVSTVRRISSNRGRLAVVGLIASTDKP